MLSNSILIWLALVAALLAGWLFGIATSPAGRSWKKRYREREVIIAKYRREMEAALVKARDRVRQLEKERDPAEVDLDMQAAQEGRDA